VNDLHRTLRFRLDAKPVIDIQVSVPSFERRDWQYQRLQDLGYSHFALGEFDQVYPFFKRPKTLDAIAGKLLAFQERLRAAGAAGRGRVFTSRLTA
jgi:GrpB-like predicted nucleotidyltransferase (UPF0157 family)